MKFVRSLLLAGCLYLGLSSCGWQQPGDSVADGHGHEEEGAGHHDHGEESAGARYAEGKGIALLDETREAIGLELAEVEEQKLAPLIPLEAQVYHSADEPSRPEGEQAGSAYATALLNPSVAEKLRSGDSATLMLNDAGYEARIWRIDPVSKDAVNSVEAILRIPDPQNTLRVGGFISGFVVQSDVDDAVLTIPRSAVLETATGKFAFVQNGDYLMRTPITVGAENAEHAAITDGIYAGDIVATKPVETLYLIELRATKGGGHSH